MKILAIESSCDETSVAIVEDGKKVLCNVVYTQIEIHKMYGGVVPEVASRHHIEKITYVIDAAMKEAQLNYVDIDKIAVTSEPGLIGSLMVGVNAAKAIGLAYHIEVVMVNHIYGHIYANYLEDDFVFPLIALVVSGGHTELVLMKNHFDFEILGQTLDDAVGEAYDKGNLVSAEILKKRMKEHIKLAKDSYDFSFSGLKSAVINLYNKCKIKGEKLDYYNLAASFQDAVIDVLVSKTIRAAQEYQAKQVIIAGGVAANSGLRQKMKEEVAKLNKKFTVPSIKNCTDNAAMIGVAGYFQILCDQSRKDI